MTTLRWIDTGDECGPITVGFACDADHAAWFAARGKDIRDLYVVTPMAAARRGAYPLTPLPPSRYRPAPQHGAYQAALFVGPSVADRATAWWGRRCPAMQFGLALVGFLVGYVALCLLLWAVQEVIPG